MNKLIIASVLCLGLGSQAIAPAALAYGVVPTPAFDPAAELRRATGSAQFPEPTGGVVREARQVQPGSEAQPHGTVGVPHNGVDVMVGGSSRFPVLAQDVLNHPSTGLSQGQVMTEDFEG